MNFSYFGYFPLVLFLIISLCILIIKSEIKYFNWVKKYWFYKRSLSSKISSFLYLLALTLFLFSLLDLRGPEQKQESFVPDQKTIIILDSSASMTVEDVRPSRFKKALIIARHFIKKAIGHQMAIVLFSDTQKKLIPFTDDIDLLDARVDGLKDSNITKGGSNISQAILESLQYFKTQSNSTVAEGNILLITDTEDNGVSLNLDIPDGVALAVVGVGTKHGGPIPLHGKKGNFLGYKKYKGNKVISKLDENFLKELSSKAKNYKYWIALSYNIPTEEIINFFRQFFTRKMEQKNVRVKPVWGFNLIILAIILLISSILLNTKKRFIVPIILFLLNPCLAQEETNEIEAFEKLKKGELDKQKKLKLAEKLLKGKEHDKALTLYEENIENISKTDSATLFNYATAQLKNGNIKDAIDNFLTLRKRLKKDDNENSKKMLNDIRKNILLALNNQQKSQQNQNDQQEKQEQSDQQNQQGGQGQQKDQDQSDKQNQQGEQKQQSQKGGDREQKKDQKNKMANALKKKEDELKKKRKSVNIPALLRQLLNDDRNLQNKYFDTSTSKKSNQEEIKDW